MSDGQQPELRWAPIPPKPSRAGRIWLVIGLVVAALAIIGVVLFFLIPRGPAPHPDSSASPTPSASPSATPSPTASPSPEPEPTMPVETEPPTADPGLDAFRAQVGVWLDASPRGLDIVASSSGQDGLSVIDTLQEDAQRLSDAQAPSSISAQWRDGVFAYSQRLTELRSAVSGGSGVSTAVDAARSAVQQLNALVGL